MSFSFGFSQADVSDDEFEAVPVQSAPSTLKIDETAPEVTPQLHSLESILESLSDVRITFDNYTTNGGNIVYRRELFDVKHQCMTEDDGGETSEIHKILLGSDEEIDLRKNVYEGGFKLWECSYDLVDEIASDTDLLARDSLLELGCGSALPSCFVFLKWLEKKATNKSIILGDFNFEVLRLVTIPNIIVHWASTLEPEHLAKLQNPDIPLKNDEIQLTSELREEFTSALKLLNISIQCISGSWGDAFADLVQPFSPNLILSSETIYSLDTLPTFIQLVQKLMARKGAIALIAAKSYYFGVGGSLKEFTTRLALCEPPLTFKTADVPNSLLKRSLVRLWT